MELSPDQQECLKKLKVCVKEESRWLKACVKAELLKKLKEQKGNLESLSASLDQQLHKKELDPIGTWVIAEVSTGVRMWLDLGDLFISRYCLQGGFEADETRFVQNFLEQEILTILELQRH